MNISNLYSEVYEVLNIFGEEYINKLPNELYENICNKRNKNSIKEIDMEIPIKEQNLMKETLEFIAYLNLNYWCNDKERKELIKEFDINDKKKEKELIEKYNTDNIFKKNVYQQINKTEEKKIAIIGKKNLIKRILEKIIFFFRNK